MPELIAVRYLFDTPWKLVFSSSELNPCWNTKCTKCLPNSKLFTKTPSSPWKDQLQGDRENITFVFGPIVVEVVGHITSHCPSSAPSHTGFFSAHKPLSNFSRMSRFFSSFFGLFFMSSFIIFLGYFPSTPLKRLNVALWRNHGPISPWTLFKEALGLRRSSWACVFGHRSRKLQLFKLAGDHGIIRSSIFWIL